MPFIAVPDCAYVKVRFAVGTKSARIGMWFKNPGFVVEDLDDLAVVLEAGMLTDLCLALAPEVSLTYMDLVGMRSRDDVYYGYPLSLVGNSGALEKSVSWGTAGVVTFRTAKRGRWYHGRIYLPGIPEEDSDYEGPSDANMILVLAAFNHFLTPGLGDWTHVVVTRYLDGEPRALGLSEPVTVYASRSQVWGFQRRRQARQ